MIEILRSIKRLLPGRRRSLLARVRELPEGQRPVELAKLFLDECVRHAADFVRGQAARQESPFQGVPQDRFFHEVMTVNFWVLERLFEGKRFTLMDRVYEAYQTAFTVPRQGNGRNGGALAERYAAYNGAWNEVTGHQDEFGLRVAERIFGPGSAYPVREASFWIVSYTHDIMDDLGDLVKRCRLMNIALS